MDRDAGPLAGRSVGVRGMLGETAAHVFARHLLGELGADVHADADELHLGSATAAEDWARSGAMALTGRSDGPPEFAPGGPASAVRAALAVLGRLNAGSLPGAELLGERAAWAGFARNAPASAGGRFRCLRAADGWLGVSLARDADAGLIPALIEAPVASDPWSALAGWLAQTGVVAAESRAIMLGLPAAAVRANRPSTRRPMIGASAGGLRIRRPGRSTRPVVVDLSALWAGPLCAHLLGMGGARVIKVESTDRPDGSRLGSKGFYELLHGGHESVQLNFDSPADRDALARLLLYADVVIEASRPRALQRLDIDAEEYAASGTVWVSITGYGRDTPDRIGFGDDVACGAGLASWSDDVPHPVGDAIGDPLTGVIAAAAASAALASDTGWLLDVSMRDCCIAAARLPSVEATVIGEDGLWWVEAGGVRHPVVEPVRRSGAGPAPVAGEHTRAVLDEIGRP